MRGVSNHFNRGEVDQEALARDDLKRVNSSASYMLNFIPSRLGSMSYRPGLETIAEVSHEDHYMVPFVFSIDSKAKLDFTVNNLSFFVDDDAVTTSAVTTAITNGELDSNITGWTDGSLGAGSIAWLVGGYLSLTGDGSSPAIASQTLTTELNTEHSMRLVIKEADITVKIGTNGARSYDIFKGELGVGEHVLSFTPDADVTLTFENTKEYRALVDTVSFEGEGSLSFATEIIDLPTIRPIQLIDVMYVTHANGKPVKVEHRGDKSWSLVEYRSDDGPYNTINNTQTTLTPGALKGNTTLTASEDYFSEDDIGRLFKLSSSGQEVSATVSVDTGAGTDSIKVTGVAEMRIFNISATIPGGSVTLQRSSDDAVWEDVETYTGTTSKSYNDEFDNAIQYYRLYVKSGNNAALDTIELELTYTGGSIDGVARVTGYTSETVVDIQVLDDFGGLDATLDWYKGTWGIGSYPTAIDVDEGRLWLIGGDNINASISDVYTSFDSSVIGDSRPIQKTIGFGAENPIQWLKSTQRLVLGTVTDEITIRSSSYGEGLTQDNTNIKSGSNQGSANLEPIKIDDDIYFIHRSKTSLFSLKTYIDSDAVQTNDANLLNKNITEAGIRRIAAVRHPETRIACVLDDGTVAIYTVDIAEEVAGWCRIDTDGEIKDVIMMPEEGEDRFYFIVSRGNNTYLEKMAMFKDAEKYPVDGFVSYSSAKTLTGLDHWEGESLKVYADSSYLGEYAVSGGEITLDKTYTDVCAGKGYGAYYISNKLSGYKSETVLTERKRLIDTGLCLMDYYHNGITIGPEEGWLMNLPVMEKGEEADNNILINDYSELPFTYDGKTESDPRIHIKATAPCKILALTYGVELDDPYGNKE